MLRMSSGHLRAYFRANLAAYFFMVLFFMLGISVGALAVKILPDQQKVELANYLHLFLDSLAKQVEWQGTDSLFTNTLYSNLKIMIILWVLGFTIVGIPFVLFIVFTRGFIIGFTVGFLVQEYVLKGLLFACVAVLPHNLLAVPALIISAVSAVSFSWILVRPKVRQRVPLFAESLRYSLICAVMGLIMVLATAIEVYFSPIVMRFLAQYW